MNWDAGRLTGPDGEDWRVPVSELEARQARLSKALADSGHESVLIDDPVELYWLTGGRQSSMLLVGADGSVSRQITGSGVRLTELGLRQEEEMLRIR